MQILHDTTTSDGEVVNLKFAVGMSRAVADRRTVLKLGAQLDLASSYAVPHTRRSESPTALNYAKLCKELNHIGAAMG